MKDNRHLAADNTGKFFGDIDGDDDTRRRRSSANRGWTILRLACHFAFREGRVSDDKAWRQVKPFRGVDAARPHWLSVEESRRLVNAADDDFRRLIQAALLCGGRYGALIHLRAKDFDARAAIVTLRTRKGDGSEKRFDVPLTGEAVEFFRQATAGRAPDAFVFTKGKHRRAVAEKRAGAAQKNNPVGIIAARRKAKGRSYRAALFLCLPNQTEPRCLYRSTPIAPRPINPTLFRRIRPERPT